MLYVLVRVDSRILAVCKDGKTFSLEVYRAEVKNLYDTSREDLGMKLAQFCPIFFGTEDVRKTVTRLLFAESDILLDSDLELIDELTSEIEGSIRVLRKVKVSA